MSSRVAICLAQLSISPSMSTIFDILGWFPLLFWVWMVWAGVVLWRRTPSRNSSGGAVVPVEQGA